VCRQGSDLRKEIKQAPPPSPSPLSHCRFIHTTRHSHLVRVLDRGPPRLQPAQVRHGLPPPRPRLGELMHGEMPPLRLRVQVGPLRLLVGRGRGPVAVAAGGVWLARGGGRAQGRGGRARLYVVVGYMGVVGFWVFGEAVQSQGRGEAASKATTPH
jgi:hypothetical protein